MMHDDSEFQQRMQRIEQLVEEIEVSGGNSPVAVRAGELVALVMELHGSGLRRICEVLEQSGPVGAEALKACAHEPLVRSLLILHELHPQELATRVEEGLEAARPYLESHGGNVELVAIEEGRVTLRLSGNCHGCPSSTLTMKNAIEQAVYEQAPDVISIEVEQPSANLPPSGGFVSLEHLLT